MIDLNYMHREQIFFLIVNEYVQNQNGVWRWRHFGGNYWDKDPGASLLTHRSLGEVAIILKIYV